MRFKKIDDEWKITEKLRKLRSSNVDEDWEITYLTHVYGSWDLMIECSFTKLIDLDEIITHCRYDTMISEWIEETLTLCGTKPNYPFE